MTQTLQLIALTAASMAILYKTPNRYLAKYLALALSIYLALQLASLYLLGNFIDYQFYNHLNLSDVAPYAFQFVTEIVILTISLALIWLFLHKTSMYLKRKQNIQLRYIFPLIVALIAAMSVPSGILRESYGIYKIISVEKKAFSAALSDLGINPEHYPTPDTIHATKGKNIIVISMESLEKGFLGDAFNSITPNLKSLSTQLTYYDDMPPIIGGGWTAASLYNHQTGMPALFTGHGNSYFQGTNNVKLTGLGHVLGKAGYNSVYIMGNAQHGGSIDLLAAYNIPVVSQNNTLGTYPQSRAGLNDLDLFEEAKLQIQQAKTAEEPFALFLSTINSHWPAGIYDERMKAKVGDIEDKLEFAVAALDYLIGDFFNFLADEALLSNTAIFIFPDHLLMGSGQETNVLRKLRENERGMYLISNIESSVLGIKPDQTLTKLDLPRLILNGAGIESNAKFLTDFIERQNTASFIAENELKLTALNFASLSRDNFLDGITVTRRGAYLDISSIDRALKFRIPEPTTGVFFDVTFTSGMTAISSSIVKVDNVTEHLFFRPASEDLEYGRFHLTISLQDNLITAYLGDKNKAGITLAGESSIKFSEEQIQTVIESSVNMDGFYTSTIESSPHLTNNVNQKANDVSRFIAHAGGSIEGNTYTNSLEALNHSYELGFKLFEIDIIQTSDKQYVAAHDWSTWQKMSGFEGNLPPSNEEFLAERLLGKYTPLDINGINNWFSTHSDAILVTDKINDPKSFSAIFIDKNRLMMELFSPAAVMQGLEAEIRSPMPSWRLLSSIQGDVVKTLQSMGITDIAASRRIIEREGDLLRALATADIHVYAFHINHDPEKNESYVVCAELDYFYGLYADNWDFDSKFSCD